MWGGGDIFLEIFNNMMDDVLGKRYMVGKMSCYLIVFVEITNYINVRFF